jgi:hypothetical protein
VLWTSCNCLFWHIFCIIFSQIDCHVVSQIVHVLEVDASKSVPTSDGIGQNGYKSVKIRNFRRIVRIFFNKFVSEQHKCTFFEKISYNYRTIIVYLCALCVSVCFRRLIFNGSITTASFFTT